METADTLHAHVQGVQWCGVVWCGYITAHNSLVIHVGDNQICLYPPLPSTTGGGGRERMKAVGEGGRDARKQEATQARGKGKRNRCRMCIQHNMQAGAAIVCVNAEMLGI